MKREKHVIDLSSDIDKMRETIDKTRSLLSQPGISEIDKQMCVKQIAFLESKVLKEKIKRGDYNV